MTEPKVQVAFISHRFWDHLNLYLVALNDLLLPSLWVLVASCAFNVFVVSKTDQ